MKSTLLRLFEERGYLNQCTSLESLDELACKGIVKGYIGFDCTAKSLHVGSLIPIMMLRTMQKAGHKPIIVMGGGTTKIGDPSGKDETRQILSDDIIRENKDSIFKIFEKFIKFGDGETDAVAVDNSDWLDDLKYIKFLRDIGRHFTINKMLAFDSVKSRLEREQPLTFIEFNYMLLQSYDFVELNRLYDCRLQMGGSDQWGNIVSGVDLGRRMGTNELFGLTSHLIITKAGAKMGKTASGAVWLNDSHLSPYDYWQFWRNTEDGDVGIFLRLFTELPIHEIEQLEKLDGKDINQAKIMLADEATKLCHGEHASREANETAKKTFEQGSVGSDLPTFKIELSELKKGIPAYRLFALSGLCDSNSAAKRLIQGKGGRINNNIIEDEDLSIDETYLEDNHIKLSFGQKKHLSVIVKGT
jgi:tyrosyl-tRNA synthetase